MRGAMRAGAALLLLGGGGLMLPEDLGAQEAESRWTAEARAWLHLIASGDFTAASEKVAPGQAAAAFTPAALEQVWSQVTGQAGALQSLAPLSESMADTLHVVELAGAFERAPLIVRVVFTPSGQVTGLFFRPRTEAPAADPSSAPTGADDTRVPPYADPSAFTEEPVTIGDEWQLEGTLTLPRSGDALPAVVLVHGSGPHDRDETIGPNRPFRDLAWGLASRGVAVLRYDKRTRVHAARMGADVTVDEEVIDDAVLALAVARAHPRIDPARVVVVGHSLGAMLAPEIAARDGQVAGAAMLAAPARGLAAVIVEQLQYIRTQSPESQHATLDAAMAQAKRLISREAPPEEMVLGAPASYFYDLDRRDPVATARSLDVPILLVHGGRDYQVTDEDFRLWREALAGRDATLEALDDLNHIFVAGQGRATPAEYARPGFVDARVVALLAEFVKGAGR